MSDEQNVDGGILQLAEIVDIPLRLKIKDQVRDIRLLDNEALVKLVGEVKQKLAKAEADKAKTVEEVEAVKRRFQGFDMNVDQIAQYCFTLDGSQHVVSLALRLSGVAGEDADPTVKQLRRQLGGQKFAALAAELSGIFPPQLKPTPKPSEGGGESAENPTDTSTTGPKTSP